MQIRYRSEMISKMNQLGAQKAPFLVIVDFKGEKGYFIPKEDLDKNAICIDFPTFSYHNNSKVTEEKSFLELHPIPISKEQYLNIFQQVHQELLFGNSYLLNLTFATPVGENLPLEHIYNQAIAPYKLYLKDQFLCYSPESFVKMEGNLIKSFPMKGTIDARIPDAEQKLKKNKKELYEHYTIVDLIRNDLSMVASEVEVTRFRYFEKINTQRGAILQTISEIIGRLPENWHDKLGDIFFTLLPAGSISGAPKEKTMEIILQNETAERGFYTGVAAYFDGVSLDSCVMIRFIKKDEIGNCFYHSGGGITALSIGNEEYEELISKIYVPIS